MWRLSWLILVFCYRWLKAFIQIMAFFVTIITNNLAGAAAVGAVLLFLTVIGIGAINSSGQCRAFSGMTISFILAIVLLFLLPSLLEGLSVLLKSWCLWFLGRLLIWVFRLFGIFCFGRPMTLKASIIYFSYQQLRLICYFSLGINAFFNGLFPRV